jgi:hypothetical protein
LADLAVDLYIAGKVPRARTEQGAPREQQMPAQPGGPRAARTSAGPISRRSRRVSAR